MKAKTTVLLGAFLALSTGVSAQAIPSGTVLPIQLNSSFSLKAQPGKVISARVMQDVVLPAGATIRAGAKVVGHVVAVTPPANGVNARISFTFDKLVTSKRTIQITVDLRAMASFVEVEDAQIPDTGPDRGTPENAWATVLVGGDVSYRGGGSVMEGSEVVGKPLFNGAFSEVRSNPDRGCRGVIDGNNGPQALWVFSSNACGIYGFSDVAISHAGRSNPVGEIVLSSHTHKLSVQSGSGMLIRVIRSGERTAEQS